MFDSVNAGKLLAVEDYFPDTVLPPHLSPFVVEGEDDYVPPEKQKLLDEDKAVDSGLSCLISFLTHHDSSALSNL